MRELLIFVAICLFQSSAVGGQTTAWGLGALSCGSFVIAVDGAKGDPTAMSDMYAMVQWAEGYITAHDNSAKATGDAVSAYTDPAGMRVWLYEYCRQHSIQPFSAAVESLILDVGKNAETSKSSTK